jgi:dihydrofolate reductase
MTSLIVAASTNDVIGRAGELPWHLPEDLRRFRRLTHGRTLVMGSVTHESIVARLGHPLTDRVSVVVSATRRPSGAGDDAVRTASSPEEAMSIAKDTEGARAGGEIVVAGGASIYRQLIHLVDTIQLTRVHRVIDGDRTMHAGWLDGFVLSSREDHAGTAGGPGYSFLEYHRQAS